MRLIDGDTLMEIYADRLTVVADRYSPDSSECGILSGAMKLLDAQPTIEPERKKGEWIPCEERLPEDDTLMLVNYIDERPDAMDIWIGWHEMENVWYIDGEEHSREHGNEVIAWMPLPEPYTQE